MVIITKENKNNYAAGTFLVVGLDNQPILKNNGKPWSGKTNSISNYYGIIVGAGKYAAVKSGVVWNPDYRIMFTPEVQEDITPVIVKDQIVEAGENTVIPEEHSEVIKDMEQIDIKFKYNNVTLPAHIGVQFYEDDDVYVECRLGDQGDEWKDAWFSDIEDKKKLYKAGNRLQDLYNALEKAILEALPSKYKYDPDMISWEKVLTEGVFAMNLLK